MRQRFIVSVLLFSCVHVALLLTAALWWTQSPTIFHTAVSQQTCNCEGEKASSTSVKNYFNRTKTEELLVIRLKELSKDLLETQRVLHSSAFGYSRLASHIQKTSEMLNILNQELPGNNNSKISSEKKNEEINREVCPEKFMGTTLSYGHPFFRKGFDRVPCENFIPIERLVTILISMPEELPRPAQSYLGIMQGVEKYYPSIRVVLCTKKEIETPVKTSISQLNISFENEIIADAKPGSIWQRLVDKVSTRYVLLAPDVTHFDDDINLERMVRVLSYNEPHVAFVGAAHRNLKGEWDNGCQQVAFKNMTATYMGGYYRSLNECLVCDFLSGPIMSKTEEILKKLKIDTSLGEGVFRDLFWRLKKNLPEKVAASCPDVMFNTNPREVEDKEYVSFANKHLIHRIVEASGRVRWYGCRHRLTHANRELCKRTPGLGLSPADMENLADVIKFFLKACDEVGAFCELYAGTLMGAVKFNGVLPWDIDGDLAFVSANFTTIEKLIRTVKKAGYWLIARYRTEVNNGVLAGGYFMLKTTNWKVDVWGYPVRSSQLDVANGRVRTKVLFAGQWVFVPHNPGLVIRNRYGAGVYQHEEHWRNKKKPTSRRNKKKLTSWSFYNPGRFLKCANPGHSSCLDQYPADGNMQFRDYCPS